MKSYRDLSIRARLLLAFLGVLIPYLALVAIGVGGFRALSQRLYSVEQEVTQDIEGLTDLHLAILRLGMPANDYLVTGDPREREEFERRLAQARGALARMESFSLQNPQARQLLGAIGSQVSQIETLSREVLAVPDPPTDHAAHAAAHAKMKALDRLGDEAAVILSQLREIEHGEIRKEVERGSGVVRGAAATALAALILSAAGGVVLALLFSRWIGYPLQIIAGASHAMAQGDLSQRVDTSSGGELAETARAFNLMAQRLEASHAALSRTNEESKALAAIGRELAQSLDLAMVGQRIIESVRTLLQVRFSALYRLEPGSGDLVAVAVSENVASSIGPGLVFPKGYGAIGLAVKERRLVVSEDVLADPRITFTPEVRARVEQASFRAIIALPLLGKEGVIGVLGIGDEQGRVFDAEEIGLAQAFADQAAMALQNAGLYAESEARRGVAEALEVTARYLAQSLDPAEVFQRITDSIRRLLGVQTTTLYRLEPESGGLRVMAASGEDDPAFGPDVVFPRGTGADGLAIEERGPVVSENILADPRLTLVPETRVRVERARFRAVLAVPLVVKEKVIGGLAVRDQEGRAFTAEEVQLAQAFADQAALSLENARLFDEAQSALVDLKAAQQRLVEGATMRALGELASGAAHHLNNLLAIVLGRVRLLLDGPEAAPVRRPLEVIERAATDAAEVVRRVSRFARMQPLEDWQALNLRQLASEVLELTRARWQDAAQAQGIRIEAVLEGSDLQPAMGNASALREVLLNLVLNAVEALPNGGKIAVRTFSEAAWVGLSVSDTGVGMSAEVRERVMEPFFTTKGPRRTGLGLSESYGIIQRHGGKLMVESVEGQGTTVTVHLLVASPSVSEGTRGEPARFAASSLRILVIDDDDEVREVVVEMLAAQGHAVLQASGGREGLALLEAGKTMDLVLTDLGMPRMTGWDVARAVRVRWPGLPVGMLTGWGEQIDEASPDRQMVAGVLSKPATPEGLREFVAACHFTSRGI
jgi:signal transduction histidine kinase/HAMP domain-containing protein